MAINKKNLLMKEKKKKFVFTYASENIVGEENTLDKVSCKATIKSS